MLIQVYNTLSDLIEKNVETGWERLYRVKIPGQ